MIDQINPPLEGLDNRAHREAYRDLRRQGHAKKMTYLGFLSRTHDRNLAIRKKEFAERAIKTNLDISEMFKI